MTTSIGLPIFSFHHSRFAWGWLWYWSSCGGSGGLSSPSLSVTSSLGMYTLSRVTRTPIRLEYLFLGSGSTCLFMQNCCIGSNTSCRGGGGTFTPRLFSENKQQQTRTDKSAPDKSVNDKNDPKTKRLANFCADFITSNYSLGR